MTDMKTLPNSAGPNSKLPAPGTDKSAGELMPDHSLASMHDQLFFATGVSHLCGIATDEVDTRSGLRAATTPSFELLRNLSASTVHLPSDIPATEVERLLRRAMWAEYDAECLCKEIERRVDSGLIILSPEFSAFELLWRRDELDHALGFARLYSALFGHDERDIVRDLQLRTGDFSRMNELLADELTIALLVAYDEVATTKSYAADASNFYPKFGHSPLVPWILRLAADEGRHYINLVTVIRRVHGEQKEQFEPILNKIVALDKQKLPYAGTFALDHDDDQFPPEMMDKCKERVLSALGMRPAVTPRFLT